MVMPSKVYFPRCPLLWLPMPNFLHVHSPARLIARWGTLSALFSGLPIDVWSALCMWHGLWAALMADKKSGHADQADKKRRLCVMIAMAPER
jgi:hypothetical protein